MSWSVILDPVDANPSNEGYNGGGVVVVLTNGERMHETCRVAFVRRNAKNRGATFKSQLRDELATARAAAEELNRIETENRSAIEAVERKRREVLDRPSRGLV